MNDLIQNKIRESVKDKTKESCGLIVDIAGLVMVVPCKNIAAQPNKFFIIDNKDYLKSSLTGKIVGSYHTHIGENRMPSMYDRINSTNLKLPYFIYHVPSDTFTNVTPLNYNQGEFKLGENDCYTLIKTYYKEELNLELPHFANYNIICNENFETNFNRAYQDAGLRRVDIGEVRKHDLLVLSYYRTLIPPHFAVYLGNGFILHHPRNGCPQTIKLTDTLLRKVYCCLRYE